jgi:hypothetical protein
MIKSEKKHGHNQNIYARIIQMKIQNIDQHSLNNGYISIKNNVDRFNIPASQFKPVCGMTEINTVNMK